MAKKNTPAGGVSRRQFIKAGAAGITSLCLAGAVSGCSTPEGKEGEESQAGGAKKGFVRPEASPWFSSLEDGSIQCELCPRECRLAPGQRAPCRVRENRGGKAYTLAYGNPALVQDDPIERKPFYHVMPGSRALSISTAGCNLACKFCEVWDMALVAPEEVHAYDMPPETVVAHALAAGIPSISFAFGEPVVFYEYTADIASLAGEAGLKNLIHTAGYIQRKPLEGLVEKLDAANVDLKSFDPAFYRDVVGGELQPVLDTLKLLRRAGIHIEITNILIPTLNDHMDGVKNMCEWIAGELGPEVPLHFARFYPLYRLSALPRTPVSTLEEARDTALAAGLKFVYIAKLTGHEAENTFCPGCGEKVIERVGFVVSKISLEKGSCRYCGRPIPGRWS